MVIMQKLQNFVQLVKHTRTMDCFFVSPNEFSTVPNVHTPTLYLYMGILYIAL